MTLKLAKFLLGRKTGSCNKEVGSKLQLCKPIAAFLQLSEACYVLKIETLLLKPRAAGAEPGGMAVTVACGLSISLRF